VALLKNNLRTKNWIVVRRGRLRWLLRQEEMLSLILHFQEPGDPFAGLKKLSESYDLKNYPKSSRRNRSDIDND
jgi:hypothetical protein